MEETKITPELLKGLRKWAQATFVAREDYESDADVLNHFRQLKADVAKLHDYLFFTLGIYQPKRTKEEYQFVGEAVKRGEVQPGGATIGRKLVRSGEMEKFRVRLAKSLAKASESADEGMGFIALASQNTPDRSPRDRMPGIELYVEQTQKQVLSAIKTIESFMREHVGQGETWDVYKGSALSEYSVGRAKLIYDDSTRFARGKITEKDRRFLSTYVSLAQESKALLERKGFGDLWYGPIFIACRDCGGSNVHGKQFGVGAHYFPGRDYVVIYSNPKPFIVELLIHELGHRYYYKFMSTADRLRFDDYFGEVAPVSEYGGSSSSEDFAEVFAHFVLGRDMTRDQIERFKAFLAAKDRYRSFANRGKRRRARRR